MLVCSRSSWLREIYTGRLLFCWGDGTASTSHSYILIDLFLFYFAYTLQSTLYYHIVPFVDEDQFTIGDVVESSHWDVMDHSRLATSSPELEMHRWGRTEEEKKSWNSVSPNFVPLAYARATEDDHTASGFVPASPL